MSRSYTPGDVITLPRVSLEEGAALATALVHRGREQTDLPPSIKRALGQVDVELGRLVVALGERTAGADAGLTPMDADRDIDGAWRTAYHWCHAWAMIPYHTDLADKGRALESALFADGLRFITRPFRDEWVESRTRLQRIDQDQLAPLFNDLGGEVILQAIRRAHDAYGAALGITAATEDSPTGGSVLSSLMAAIRRYVLKVSAHVEPDEPDTQVLADHLLEPLIRWEYRQPSTPAESPADTDQPPVDAGPPADAAPGATPEASAKPDPS